MLKGRSREIRVVNNLDNCSQSLHVRNKLFGKIETNSQYYFTAEGSCMSQNPRMGQEQSEASSAVSLALSFSLGSSLLQFLLEVAFPGFSFVIGSFLSSWGDQSSKVPWWWGRFPGWFYPQRLPGWGETSLSIKIDLVFFSSPEQLRMADLTWNEEMKNKTSSAFSILATKVEKEMEGALKKRKLNLRVVVAELLPGSVLVRCQMLIFCVNFVSSRII